MSWFENLTGCSEESPAHVRAHLRVEGQRLHCASNRRSWQYGHLETPSLAELRARVQAVPCEHRSVSIQEIVANVQHLHLDTNNQHALFQVASQFNLLEMVGPDVTPERGVGIYEHDRTQGPACAIAAGAGTIYRNYFAVVNGQAGQSESNQIDCLSDVGVLLGNADERLWQMTNGYALPSVHGLQEIDRQLGAMNESERDRVRQSLRIGLQWGTQVTLADAAHLVSHAYCSALPVAYTEHPRELWARFATLILEASYEATICAAILNASNTKNPTLFLTLLGGGAFGNEVDWIVEAIRRALHGYRDSGLDVSIVSYGRSNPRVQQLAKEIAAR